jgi:hypothetical protein
VQGSVSWHSLNSVEAVQVLVTGDLEHGRRALSRDAKRRQVRSSFECIGVWTYMTE